jgi:lipopolysaccharide/colanic/teichoic acid biosynthesis glycosyltransferase
MTTNTPTLAAATGPRSRTRAPTTTPAAAADPFAALLLPLADMAVLLLVAWLAAPGQAAGDGAAGFAEAAWFGAVLAPFMLHGGRAPAFGRGLGGHALRFAIFATGITALGLASGHVGAATPLRWAGWLVAAFALTLALRAAAPRRAARRDGGVPTAYVGAGDRVAVHLVADRPISPGGAAAKRAEDLLVGGLLTLLLLPLLALIALAIRLDSAGPVLFRQRRHGLDNAEFDILKFRTMRHGPAAAALQQTTRDDPRVTRVGRWLRAFSLDELPQLFNVVAGSMSLVGPRPHATQMRTANLLGSEITADYVQRHRVKPGITGWAQVHGARGATEHAAQLQRRVDLDLHYIAHWSIALDLWILLLTARVVAQRTNAF